jgi:hypothetical protein
LAVSDITECAEAQLLAAGWTLARRAGWWTPPEHGLPRPTRDAISTHLRDCLAAADGVIFLDFDGVVNSTSWRAERDPFPRRGDDGFDLILTAAEHDQLLRAWIDPARVALVDRIAREGRAVVVVSSSWRSLGLDVVRPALWDAGLTAPVVGRIASTDWARSQATRGERIADWLSHHPAIHRWVALDDQADYHRIDPAHAVAPRDADGLTPASVEQALAILGATP